MPASRNGGRISTHEATIKTAAVEVKTLTISGKQVTLAVFRQLEEQLLLDLSSAGFDYRGVPWGRVNYCSKECFSYDHFGQKTPLGPHLHVVWQGGDRLYQSTICSRSAEDWRVRWTHDSPEYQTYEALWRQRYAELEALDQLFIAV